MNALANTIDLFMDESIMQNQRGFTLFELLITFIILVILLTLGLPGFSQQIQNSRTRTTALELLQAIQQARTLAVSQNRRVTLKNDGSWKDGWEIFVDGNNNGLRDNGEDLLRKRAGFAAVAITPNQPLDHYISFIGTGESRYIGAANSGGLQMGTFKICPDAQGDAYALILARSGRIRMEDLPLQECSETST